ncbi:MAG: 3-methyl-2-oxobutanoate hydroxymethyltransferase, partial [Saprospiraceae bacterium]|nr:3-methyl-2-oxobutanoate hydroxymethyltransferase [Saprospiraceae bacterium]
IVLEKIPAQLTREVSETLNVPTIGIGAGKYADGQVLVTHDMLGITKDFKPRFLRRYLELFDEIGKATKLYISDVKDKNFPSDAEQY